MTDLVWLDGVISRIVSTGDRNTIILAATVRVLFGSGQGYEDRLKRYCLAKGCRANFIQYVSGPGYEIIPITKQEPGKSDPPQVRMPVHLL